MGAPTSRGNFETGLSTGRLYSGFLCGSVQVVVRLGESAMPTIFRNKIKPLWASVQERHAALNKRCSETGRCVRQDMVQQQLVEQIRIRLLRLKLLDPRNEATYNRNLAIVEADPVLEKSHLRLVA